MGTDVMLQSQSETNVGSLTGAIANLDAWLETMRQDGGYGGPVAHWWQNRYQFTGPGLDWRYEGILVGYRLLAEKTGDPFWVRRLSVVARDLIEGQCPDGSYRASRFEINPGVLGTPHEAAATFGLLQALPLLPEREAAMTAARCNLSHLIERLWDPGRQGFNDAPGVAGIVPNKVATLAMALMAYGEAARSRDYQPYARAALEDVVRYQLLDGPLRGAVHQYAAGAREGDGRFFPFYIARCVPSLLMGASVFHEQRYRDAAHAALDFLSRAMHQDGSWPQVVYADGSRAEWPRWIAGVADILLAYHVAECELPDVALRRLLRGQEESGGFRTGFGFASQVVQRTPPATPDYRDVTPVVGWNDKVFRLLSTLLPAHSTLPAASIRDHSMSVIVRGKRAMWHETSTSFSLFAGLRLLYEWQKDHPWAHISGAVRVR